ncbi:hypothetical protein B9479_005147 [Cryptococcus floricola]|uniref:Uncharacterized protein n=1 Tax=Cryptococcus floricola TaxID=2591691 RepID=A0A5D3AVF3_9TREE|nr:hypothetical protein B9479_005147 [Cryptococcus floricola]
MSLSTPSPTQTHLLSLPPSLQPLSPPHAALHLARLRLLLSIPAGSSFDPGELQLPVEVRNMGVGRGVVGGWCHMCGGLRKGQGGAAKKEKPQGKEKGEGKSKAQEIRERVRKRARSSSPPLTEEEQEAQRYARSLQIASASTSTKARRQPAECTTCGAPYVRPKPCQKTVEEFGSARRTRRKVKEREREKEEEEEKREEKGEEMDVDVEEGPPPPLLTQRPFSHIPTSSPNLPTYPLPPPSKPPAPPPSHSSSASPPPVTGAADKKKKKPKKSGLSKLLAENKERNEAQKGASMWGF